jgi:hypothetical protein
LDELGPEVFVAVSEVAGFGVEIPFPDAVAIDEPGDALAVAAHEEGGEAAGCAGGSFDVAFGEGAGEGFDEGDHAAVLEGGEGCPEWGIGSGEGFAEEAGGAAIAGGGEAEVGGGGCGPGDGFEGFECGVVSGGGFAAGEEDCAAAVADVGAEGVEAVWSEEGVDVFSEDDEVVA